MSRKPRRNGWRLGDFEERPTQDEFIQAFRESIDLMREMHGEIDFLGTGSDGDYADKCERQNAQQIDRLESVFKRYLGEA